MEKPLILEIATEEMGPELCRFYSQFNVNFSISKKLKSPTVLSYDRHDFFAPYRVLGDDFMTYALRSRRTHLIEGTATFAAKTLMLPGESKPQRVALALDLRIANSREAIMAWSHYFLPSLQEVKNRLGVSQIFSYLNLSESTALNALIRPRNARRPLPKYHLFRKVNLTTLHGYLPGSPPPLESLSVRRAEGVLQEKLIEYLLKKWSQRTLTPPLTSVDLKASLSRIPGVQWSDFLVALTHDDSVVGCALPWSSGGSLSTQKISVSQFGLQGTNLAQFLRFARFLGMTRPLPEANQELDFVYLLHLHADNEDIFESLVASIYHRLLETQFLAYTWTEDDFRSKPPRRSVSVNFPFGLYALLGPEDKVPDFLSPAQEGLPLPEGWLF